MKSIYIVVTHTGTWLSRIIKWCTGGNYTHVSLSLDADLKELYSFGRKRPYNPFIAGFVIESIESDFYKRFHNTRCKIFRMESSDENYERLKERIQYFIEHKETFKYNFLGLITYLIRYPLHRRNAFFCSQFVATVLSESEILEFDKSLGSFAPWILHKLKVLHRFTKKAPGLPSTCV